MSSQSLVNRQYLLLADDDEDDCLLFRDALEELALPVDLEVVHNGERLMQQLADPTRPVPDILFLDLNMPRKNGFECLAEIKQDERLKHLSIVIFSTSFKQDMADQLHGQGAKHCIRKPNEFAKLKEVIHHALVLTTGVAYK